MRRIAQLKLKPGGSKSPRYRNSSRRDSYATVSRTGTFTLVRDDLTRIRLHPVFDCDRECRQKGYRLQVA